MQGGLDTDWKPPTFSGLSNSDKIMQSQPLSGGPNTASSDSIPACGTSSNGIAANDLPAQRTSKWSLPSPGENDAGFITNAATSRGSMPSIGPEGRFSSATPAPQREYQPGQSRAVGPVGDSDPRYTSGSEAAKNTAVISGRARIARQDTGAFFNKPSRSSAMSRFGGAVDVTSTIPEGDNLGWPWRDPVSGGGGVSCVPNPNISFGKSDRGYGNAGYNYNDTAAANVGYSPAPPTKRRSSIKSGARRRSSGSSTRAKSSNGSKQDCAEQVRSFYDERRGIGEVLQWKLL